MQFREETTIKETRIKTKVVADKSFLKKAKETFFGTSIQERINSVPAVVLRSAPKDPYPKYGSKGGLGRADARRSSVPSQPIGSIVNLQKEKYRVVQTDWIMDVIPIIRKLVKVNPDMGQALHNVVTLGNTGHKIMFDKSVSPDMVLKMRKHLCLRQEEWASGSAGMDGLVNKMFAQLLIGGALSNEWVPNLDLDGIQACILVNPEEIRFVLEDGNIKYSPYQKVRNGYITDRPADQINFLNLIKLNPNTYHYYGLNGDTEIPYGFPPYLAAMERVDSQAKMNKNIDFVVDQLGMLGFLHALIGKPDQQESESDINYNARMDALLDECKVTLNSGVKDGVVVGFKDETEFEWNPISKGFADALAIFKNNELQLASGLKQDATLWGRDYNTSETQITVIFIKMLSELSNIQNIVKCNLKFGYELELRLAGYIFDGLEVRFNRSTLQDDYKFQQGQEIRVRNVKDKLIMGIINQDQAADELDYDEPAFPEPQVSWDVLAGGTDPVPGTPGTPAPKKKRQAQKNKSAKKTRDSNKPIAKK